MKEAALRERLFDIALDLLESEEVKNSSSQKQAASVIDIDPSRSVLPYLRRRMHLQDNSLWDIDSRSSGVTELPDVEIPPPEKYVKRHRAHDGPP